MITLGVNGEPIDDAPKDAGNPLSEAISKSLAQSPQNSGPINPFKPDQFREPLNKLDSPWPFVPKDTLSKTSIPQNRAEPQRESPPIPVDLPGATPVVSVAPLPTVTKPIFTVPPKPPAPPPEPPKPEPPKNEAAAEPAQASRFSMLKNIRTYESDVADVLANRNSSRTSMAIAENVKRGEGETLGNSTNPESQSHLGSKLALILASLVLIGAGMVGGYYFYAKSPLGAKVPVVATPKTPPVLISYESQAVISMDGLNRAGFLKKLATEMGKVQPPGSIKEIVATEVKEGAIYRVPSAEMAYIMSVPVPDMILRTLNLEWMLGIYANRDGSTKNAFVVVTTNLFQNAFAGMLAWEKGLPEDIKDFLAAPSEKLPAQLPRGRFTDQVVRNKDVRAFVTDNEDTLLVYSFVDNATLVVAANNEALGAVISRLENKAFVR